MKLSIIIVSWNTAKLTLKCIQSLFKYILNIEFEIFLVDNNSTDSTVADLEKYKSENNLNNLFIIKNSQNVGFAKANNLAIQKSAGEYIFLLNPDTELIDNSFLKLIEFLENNHNVGIVGPKLLNNDLSLQRSCRHFPALLDQIFIQLKFYNLFAEKIKSIRNYFMLNFDHQQIFEVDQIMGAAMLVRRQVFDKIGLLDENFWAVFEEVDFCKRTKTAGCKIYFMPNTKIVHHKEQSFRQMPSLRKQLNFNRSLYHYFRKHKPFWQLIILWLLQPINLLLTFVDSQIGIRKLFGKQKDL